MGLMRPLDAVRVISWTASGCSAVGCSVARSGLPGRSPPNSFLGVKGPAKEDGPGRLRLSITPRRRRRRAVHFISSCCPVVGRRRGGEWGADGRVCRSALRGCGLMGAPSAPGGSGGPAPCRMRRFAALRTFLFGRLPDGLAIHPFNSDSENTTGGERRRNPIIPFEGVQK